MKRLFTLLCTTLFFTLAQAQAIKEKQPIADQGNGYYKNPIFPGNYGDPSVVRVKDDYYIAFSRKNGIIIWHSKDLVNWKPVTRHRLPEGYNTVWAIDLQYFNGMFHIYMPIRNYPNKKKGAFGNFVIRAKEAAGPWSKPIHLEIDIPDNDEYSGIDPGFIQTPEGEKYLYVSHGWVMKLNEEGTKAVSKPEVKYKGWQYPQDWIVECMCLESPKLFYKNDFYYMVSAEGGTNGPSTAHMSVVARAKSPLGPWENSPFNPLTHTYSHDEPFWHQGHGTVFEAADGTWWTVFHGRKSNYVGMGRSTLLMPIEWTEDGWPVVKNSFQSHDLIPMPQGKKVPHGLALSDSFESKTAGMQWYFDNKKMPSIEFGGGKLVVEALEEPNQVFQYAVNESFEVSVKVEGAGAETIGSLLLGSEAIGTDGNMVFFADGPDWRIRRNRYEAGANKGIWLKIKNFRKDLSFYFSTDGMEWQKFNAGIRSHDSYNIALTAKGKGKITFKEFTYQGLE